MATWGISQPHQGRNAQIVGRVRLVIEDVPDDATDREVLDWLDDYDWQLDSADREDEWSANQQLTAESAPRVRWRGRPGRPEVGPAISIRLDQDLLDRLDGVAQMNGESRAAALRRLLRSALP
jgi:glycine/D-amino acid oxidase-like deaminating enzyme